MHQHDLGERRAEEALGARVNVVDAQLGVLRERVSVARLDEHREQRQVAAHVEHAADARGGDVVVHPVQHAVELHLPLVRHQLLVMLEDVLQQTQAVAGRAFLRIEVAPHRAGGRLELGLVLRFLLAIRNAQAHRVAKIAHGVAPSPERSPLGSGAGPRSGTCVGSGGPGTSRKN